MAQPSITERLEDLRSLLGIETVQEFVDRLNQRQETPFPYATARRYHRDREPPVGYLVAVTRAFDGDLMWLATGEGEATKVHSGAAQMTAAAIPDGGERLERAVLGQLLPPETTIRSADEFLQAKGERGQGIPGIPARPMSPGVPYWIASLAQVELRLWATDALDPLPGDSEMDLGEAIGKALRGPMEALGVDPARMQAEDRTMGDYITAMVPALFSLTAERARQRRAQSMEQEYQEDTEEEDRLWNGE